MDVAFLVSFKLADCRRLQLQLFKIIISVVVLLHQTQATSPGDALRLKSIQKSNQIFIRFIIIMLECEFVSDIPSRI